MWSKWWLSERSRFWRRQTGGREVVGEVVTVEENYVECGGIEEKGRDVTVEGDGNRGGC